MQRPGFQADQHELIRLEGEWLVHDRLQGQGGSRSNPCQNGDAGCPRDSRQYCSPCRESDSVIRDFDFRKRNQLKYLNLSSNQDPVDSDGHSRDFVENQDFLVL